MVSERHVESLRARLDHELERLDSELATLDRETSDASTAEQDADAVARSTSALEDRLGDARERSEEVRDARQRLDEGTFGQCVVCGGDIDDEKLLLDPTTRHCRLHGGLGD